MLQKRKSESSWQMEQRNAIVRVIKCSSAYVILVYKDGTNEKSTIVYFLNTFFCVSFT